MCKLVHTCVHKTYGVHEIVFGMPKIKLEIHIRYSWVANEEPQKSILGAFYENLAVDIVRKLYIRVDRFFIL